MGNLFTPPSPRPTQVIAAPAPPSPRPAPVTPAPSPVQPKAQAKPKPESAEDASRKNAGSDRPEEEDTAKAVREAAQKSRQRGRTATVATGWRGILGLRKTDADRKSLLGE